jgi:hypothetical protein|tara:strand:- start:246 stop:458 length:213 start_codon:yes stop_codon:yes gene_type:complete
MYWARARHRTCQGRAAIAEIKVRKAPEFSGFRGSLQIIAGALRRVRNNRGGKRYSVDKNAARNRHPIRAY